MTAAEIAKLEEFAATRLMGWVNDPKWPGSLNHDPVYRGDNFYIVIHVKDWHPASPDTGQIWMCHWRMKELGWSLRLSTPCAGEENLSAAMYYTARHYCSYQKDPDEWGGPHPNPHENCLEPKHTPWMKDKEPCLAMLKAMWVALEGGREEK